MLLLQLLLELLRLRMVLLLHLMVMLLRLRGCCRSLPVQLVRQPAFGQQADSPAQPVPIARRD